MFHRSVPAVAAVALVACVASTLPAQAQGQAQTWPQRTVRLIVPLPPGSGMDLSARVVAERLAQKWGQAVVVENRQGADGIPAVTTFLSARDNHTFLFIVDPRTVIDAAVGGNEARFINHNCDGNCESTIEKRRVYIEAVRDIARGEELGYDYEIGREKDDPPNIDEIYACRCGAANCRGTMLWPAKRPVVKKRKAAKKKAHAHKRSPHHRS